MVAASVIPAEFLMSPRDLKRKKKEQEKLDQILATLPDYPCDLRSFQAQVIRDLYGKIRGDGVTEGHTDIAIVAGTGSGKTVMAAWIASDAVKRGKRVWITVHLDSLIDQTLKRFRWVFRSRGMNYLNIGVIHNGYPCEYQKMVQICAQETVANRLERKEILPECFPGVLMEDECHTARWRTASETIRSLTGVKLSIGLTATPLRTKRTEGFAEYYSAIVLAPSVREITEMGGLAPMRFKEATDSDLEVRDRLALNGFDDDEIKTVYDTPKAIAKVLDLYEAQGEGGKAIAFCCSVSHASHLAKAARERGIVAEAINFKTPRGKPSDRGKYPTIKSRVALFAAFESGEIQMLTAIDTLAVGFDVADTMVGIGLRPTESRSLHIQQVGRVRRAAPGKAYGIWIDYVGNCADHDYGDDEWTEEEILAPPSEPGDFVNPFVKQCSSCGVEIPAVMRICPHCGTEQEMRSAEKPQPRDFDGILIETVRPCDLNADREDHAQKYYRFLLARSVLKHRRLPGAAYALLVEPKYDRNGAPVRDEAGNIVYANPFAKWALNRKIPYGRSAWTLGAIFQTPDSVEHARLYYGFLAGKYADRDMLPQEKQKKIWYAIECEFNPETVAQLRVALSSYQPSVEIEQVRDEAPVRFSRSIDPLW